MGLFGAGTDHSVQLNRIERKLDAILASLGLDAAGGGAGAEHPRMGEVRSLAASGRKIDAIKLYRELMGVGLKEAKGAVDAM